MQTSSTLAEELAEREEASRALKLLKFRRRDGGAIFRTITKGASLCYLGSLSAVQDRPSPPFGT